MMGSSTILTPTQRYAAGALLSLALHQAQIHQTPLASLLPSDDDTAEERTSSGSSTDSVTEDPHISHLWIHQNFALLRPVFRFLQIDPKAWTGLEETARSSPAKHRVGAFFRLLSEDNDETSSERLDQELALAKAVDATEMSMGISPVSSEATIEKHHEDEHACHENSSSRGSDENLVEEETLLSYQRKVVVLYELLSACVADIPEDDKKDTRQRKGYDARHRVALRLLATWLGIKWIKMEAMEVLVACSARDLVKSEEPKEVAKSQDKSWVKWKRGGIIGAAAITGGTLLAITGGLAAPAIAAGFGALAPTLGSLVPVIGASGFAAAATAAGSVAGSVAVAASLGAAGAGLTGYKTARRIGSVDEFEFKAIGKNHNQGCLSVGIFVSGLVFEEKDFIRPWEGREFNLERYVLRWESKNLILLSTAIQDWLASRIAMELMKQGAMMTVLSSLLTALAWPATLLAATDFIDSKWTIAVDRSDKAGKLLAEVLAKGLQGNRPVTLIGFSLGARVVFKCLKYLARMEIEGGSVVERVVLLGAPVPIQDEYWETARRMVAGRFVNAYSTSDWMLGIAFRASLLTQGLAGIQPVEVPGIENVDVTELIEGHSSYLRMSQQILERLELDAYFPVFRSSENLNQVKT
ncbi:PREDICTED: transmembrane and coiled-coil domain-containing protein 4-like [Nelumbo nucifera]|uniref:Transmembrane and coiled-coil domain-containing protein 4-like n=2 Tax=Nelumbo nucifera TaxID=4432 RepID=A0A822ZQ29_NELNU|nr:PREDICTED: transmembrane and coiled-coil domain-containing protein 4-like [Nelumbo nucifera]DAD46943.1 TPA_asm: hypothetical protein HUJ06_016880 [Nelumbo nucifera]